MIPRPDLLDAKSPAGIEVFQLTNEPDTPACHIYMEAQIFTPDSKQLVVHRSAHPHGSDMLDPEHRYLLVDLENAGAVSPITDELGPTSPSISPDGQWLYYFVNETKIGPGGRLTLRRRKLDGSERTDITVIDGCIPGTKLTISNMYPLSTISSDGNRIATCGFLGDGSAENDSWGLIVVDIPTGETRLIMHGPSWCNIHPQYCRSTDAAASHDIMVQENHGCLTSPDGTNRRSVAGLGADIHVIRDDGSKFRDFPWGRDGVEGCQGHQCWRGRSTWAIGGTGVTKDPAHPERHEQPLIESQAVPHDDHNGAKSPDSHRNDLARNFDLPRMNHFGTDIAGERLITDQAHQGEAWHLYFSHLGKPGVDAATDMRYLLNTQSPIEKKMHTHPFLSPDGSMGFFNSISTGVLQAYMIKGLDQL